MVVVVDWLDYYYYDDYYAQPCLVTLWINNR